MRMVVVSVDEINLQRLLDRAKRLCRENLSANIWKLKAAIVELETIFSRLQDDRFYLIFTFQELKRWLKLQI